jgi:two-component system, cell cycle response regulator DivK
MNEGAAKLKGRCEMPKILIVEDSEESRDSLAGRLQCSGFAVVLAASGKTGIAMAQTEKPDLILMDMNMPEIDGWEATRRIKSVAGCESLPVIALTEHALPGDRDRALGAGCADCHDKPIEFAELLAKIELLLQNRPTPAATVLNVPKA